MKGEWSSGRSLPCWSLALQSFPQSLLQGLSAFPVPSMSSAPRFCSDLWLEWHTLTKADKQCHSCNMAVLHILLTDNVRDLSRACSGLFVCSFCKSLPLNPKTASAPLKLLMTMHAKGWIPGQSSHWNIFLWNIVKYNLWHVFNLFFWSLQWREAYPSPIDQQ